MKNLIVPRVALIAALALITLGFVSCSSKSSIEGTYTQGGAGTVALDLKSGGKATFTMMGDDYACTFKVNGDKLPDLAVSNFDSGQYAQIRGIEPRPAPAQDYRARWADVFDPFNGQLDGPISGGRGQVRRVETGTYQLESDHVFALDTGIRLRLTQTANDAWTIEPAQR